MHIFPNLAKQGSKGLPPLGGVWGKEAWEASIPHLFPFSRGGEGKKTTFK